MYQSEKFWGDKFNAVYTIEIFNSGTNWKIVIIDHSGLIFSEGGVGNLHYRLVIFKGIL